MKIKAVSEITGLSDRTIRYYFEQHLIFPIYSENYLGRKSFDFSQSDIDALKNIAVLRRFDFTINEIQEIINDVNKSAIIISNVKHRTKKAVLDGEEKLLALSTLSAEKSYTLEQLAEELSKPRLNLPEHNETIKRNIPKLILSVIKTISILIVVWMPVVLSLFVLAISINDYHYPVFEPFMTVLTIVSLLPSIGALIISRTNWKYKKVIKQILLALCVLSIPTCFVLSSGIVTRSETTDFRNYRDFDAGCLANRDVVFQELFPQWPHYFENVKQTDGNYETEYLDAHYYYHFYQGLDYTYDIYAEWPLHQDAYNKEVARVAEVFKKATENKTYNYKFMELKKGSYNCLILYSGDEPFNKATNNYTYIIFAHNNKNKTVRYICCDSLENGADQPYYLSLDW